MVVKNYALFIDCLEKVISGDKFYTVLNKDIKKSSLPEKDKVNAKTVLGSSIRHYLFFKYFLDKKFNINEGKIKFGLIYFLNDYCFTNRYTENDIIATLQDFVLKNNIDVDLFKIMDFFKSKTPFELLKEEFNGTYSDTYFSLRYNVPEWIFKMVKKHYGLSHTISTFRSFSKKQNIYLFKNLNEDININDSIFKEIDENLYQYIGNSSFKKNVLVTSNKLIQTNLLDYEISKKISIRNLDNVLLYTTTKSNLSINIFNKCIYQNTINLISNDFSKLNDVLQYVRKYKTINTYYAECTPEGLEARISRKVNFALCSPKTSSISSVITNPEYLLNFDQNEITSLIEHQKLDIEEVSKQVLIGGTLIYVTYTLNKKENEDIVANFISTHPGYFLKEQKVYFSNEKEQTAGYYAIIGREF